MLRKKSKSLAIPYILWLSVYLLAKLLAAEIFPGILENPGNAFPVCAKDWFEGFFGFGTDLGDGNPKFAGQFWFVRDLILFTILSPSITLLAEKFPVAFLVSVSLFFVCGDLPFHRSAGEALFFYVAGIFWGIFDIPLFEKIDRISWCETLFLFALAFILHDQVPENSFLISNLNLSSCLLALKFSAVLCKSERAFRIASKLSGFSFWIYAVHMPILITLVIKLWRKIFSQTNSIFCLAEYLGETFLTVAIGLLLGIALKRFCPKLFTLFSGGRA